MLQLKDLFAALIVLTLLVSSGCDLGTYTPPTPTPDPNLRFTGVTVNKSRAAIGDRIEVHWDYVNANKLGSQKLNTIYLMLQGLRRPDEYPLALAQRDFSFEGPVTLALNAKDNSNPSREINLFFDIKLTEEYHFTAEVESTHREYPRLGYPSSGSARRAIDFSQFLGIYEVVDRNRAEDGVIDYLVSLPGMTAYLPSDKAFRALSWDVNERAGFGIKQGSAFPFLDAGFLGTTDGVQFAGIPHADVVIFAGAIAYDGTVTTVKSPEGEIEARSGVVKYEPIFVAIDIRTTRDGTGRPIVADIHVGNLIQGLVVSVFHGFTLNRGLGQWNVTYSVPAAEAVGVIRGSIKGSMLGYGVTTSTGQVLTTAIGGVDVPGVYVKLLAIDFVAPFYPDTNLGGRVKVN